jgi:hypothetical protein
MFCEHCGSKKEEDGQFCHNCGREIGGNLTSDTDNNSTEDLLNEEIFYSSDWRQKKVFAVASLPYFDVMVDNKSLYIIQMPRYKDSVWGLFIGLVLLNIIGAAIGASMGGSSEAKKRKFYRSAWVNLENKLISRKYKSDIFLVVPVTELKSSIILEKNKFILSYKGKGIVLQKGQKNFDIFKQYIEKYVL